MIALRRILAASEIAAVALRARAELSPKARFTEHYVAKDGENEVAFVSIDANPGVDYLVLYELFVDRRGRRQGHGTRIVDAVAGLARARGYNRIRLRPHALDNVAPADVETFYSRAGFLSGDTTGELEKAIG
jgi:GNAT superfamily N-acetyltransferase